MPLEDRVPEPSSNYAPPAPKSAATGSSGAVAPDGGGGGDTASAEKTRVIFVPWEEGTAQAAEWKTKSEQWNHKKADKFEIVYYTPGQTSDALVRVSSDPNGVVYIRGHGAPGSPGLETKVDGKADMDFLPMEDVCSRLVEMGLDQKFKGSIKFHACYSGTIPTAEGLAAKNAKLDRKITDAQGAIQSVKARGNLDASKVITALFSKSQKQKRTKDRVEIGTYEQIIEDRERKKRRETSIAGAGANLLRGMGFEQCTFFGYLGPIESLYGSMDTSSTDPKDWHKYVDLESLQEMPAALRAELQKPGANVHKVRASVARIRIR